MDFFIEKTAIDSASYSVFKGAILIKKRHKKKSYLKQRYNYLVFR